MPVTVPLNINKPDTNETRSTSLGDLVPQAHHCSDPGARGMGCEMLVPCHTHWQEPVPWQSFRCHTGPT